MVYTEDEAKPWTLKVGDKSFTPRKRSTLTFLDTAYRRLIYSPKRILYPMKRVGFVPGGKSDVSNRGKGEFVRITWDEALDTMASEMKRIKSTYGNAAILNVSGGHGQKKAVHSRNMARLLNAFGGGTLMVRNPDSWEGWYWGAEHVWGFDWGTGKMDEFDLLEDVMLNAKLLVCWSTDSLTTNAAASFDSFQVIHWLKEIGIKQVYIMPDLAHQASKYADKWIAVRPGTDPSLAAAIANVWITEGTYMKDYVNTHGYGFDKWNAYVMGTEDGVPKTPEWAEKISGVKARDIRALAREWASKPTSICLHYGTACRTPYSHEWARMTVLLLTMQGLGKPGVTFFSPRIINAPKLPTTVIGTPTALASVADNPLTSNPVAQSVYQTVLPGAILNPPVSWYGGGIGGPRSDQYVRKTYPLPGNPEVKMLWMDTVSRITNWNCGNEWIAMYKSPKFEFIVAQHPMMEDDALFADLVLPTTASPFEQDDIYSMGMGSSRDGPQWGNVVGRLYEEVH